MDAEEIRRARAKAGLKSWQMAARLGVNVDTYRSWESGRRTPREENWPLIRAIAAGEPLPREEIAALRDQVSQLQGELRRLALLVAEHEADLSQLRSR